MTEYESDLKEVTEDLRIFRHNVAATLERRDALIREAVASGEATQYRVSQWAGISLARVGMICDLSKAQPLDNSDSARRQAAIDGMDLSKDRKLEQVETVHNAEAESNGLPVLVNEPMKQDRWVSKDRGTR